MPQPGDIFIYRQFQFPDGTKRDKWFVALNASDNQRPCLALQTTSSDRWYGLCRKGCNQEKRCFFAPAAWQSCFHRDTFIKLPEIYEFPAHQLIELTDSRAVEFKSSLVGSGLEQLKQCLSFFKQDVSVAHWAMIYKKHL